MYFILLLQLYVLIMFAFSASGGYVVVHEVESYQRNFCDCPQKTNCPKNQGVSRAFLTNLATHHPPSTTFSFPTFSLFHFSTVNIRPPSSPVNQPKIIFTFPPAAQDFGFTAKKITMADQEERSDRKRARGDEDEHRIQFPLRWVAGRFIDDSGAPVSQKDLGYLVRSQPVRLEGTLLTRIETPIPLANDREWVGRHQEHMDGEEGENLEEEEEETDEQENAHRLTMEETHDQQGGAGFQEAEEEHERPTRKRRRIRGADSLSPDRGDPDEAVPEWFDSTAGSDVDLEATNSQACFLTHEGRQDDPMGDDGTSLNRGEGSEDDEVMEKRVVRRQQGELVPITSKKTRTKTTTTTRTESDGTTTTTITKRTTKVSRKRFERR
ncbi:hypothetical protein K456DRAFT_32084 [Colletotrichum gloeosporioides 23]|nr:hypothetical protein K456DRAFT_32084 [Colletotrichum gloeosporioides 23]